MSCPMLTARGAVPMLVAATFMATFPSIVAAADGVTTSGTGTTRLYVRTMPPGATVTVDGTAVGQSDGLFLVPAGTVKVTVQFAGQPPQARTVDIAEGQIARLEIELSGTGGPPPAAANQPSPSGTEWPGSPEVCVLKSSRPRGAEQPLTKFDDIFAKPIDLECVDMPLREVFADIGKKSGIHVTIDEEAVMNEGGDLEAATSVSVAGLPLDRTLDHLVRGHKLDWTVEDDGVLITSASRLQEMLITHVHDVTDLCEEPSQSLIDLIMSVIDPPTWDSWGGPGTIKPDASASGKFLVVSQTLAVHRQVRGLLDCLRRLKSTPPEQRMPLAADGYWGTGEGAVEARQKLNEPVVGIELPETSLREAVGHLAKAAGVGISIDARALGEAGLDVDATEVSLTSTTLPLGRLLERLLTPVNLAFTVIDDRLTVTVEEPSLQQLSTAVYPVDRLVGTGKKDRSLESLVELLQSTVEPPTWETQGGLAAVRPVGGDVNALVISQTTQGHRAVDAFLKSLR